MRHFFFHLNRRLKKLAIPFFLKISKYIPESQSGLLHSKKSSIADLERVVSQAKNIHEFINSKILCEEYFQALSAYYGKKKFHRESYFRIVQQLRELCINIPELADSLWSKPQNPVKFQIENRCATSGRGLNQIVWRLYRADFLNSLRVSSGIASPEIRDFKQQEEQLALAKGELISKIAAHKKMMEEGNLKKSEKIKLQVQLYKQINTTPRFRSSASFLLYRFLITQQSNYFFELNDADLIINFFRQLHQNPSMVLELKDRSHSPWSHIIKSLLPSVKDLLANKLLFPTVYKYSASGKKIPVGSLASSFFNTIEVRPLHAIWCGIIMHDCLGGDISSLASLTARRWAIGGLSGARSFLLERSGLYQGSLRLIPMINALGEKIYSCASATPIFGSMMIVGESNEKKNLLEEWLLGFRKVSLDLLPVAVSDSRTSDVAQLRSNFEQIPDFFLRKNLGRASDFRITDLKATKYLVDLPIHEGIRQYGDNFIFDATLFDAGELHIISASVANAKNALERNFMRFSNRSSKPRENHPVQFM